MRVFACHVIRSVGTAHTLGTGIDGTADSVVAVQAVLKQRLAPMGDVTNIIGTRDSIGQNPSSGVFRQPPLPHYTHPAYNPLRQEQKPF